MPITDLVPQDDWNAWLQSIQGRGGGVGGLQGDVMYGPPGMRPPLAGALNPPTIEGTLAQPGALGAARPAIPGNWSGAAAGAGEAPMGFQLSGRPAIPGAFDGAPSLPSWLPMILAGGSRMSPAMAAASAMMASTPTARDQAPTNLWFQRPSGVGGMPGPGAPMTADPGIGSGYPTPPPREYGIGSGYPIPAPREYGIGSGYPTPNRTPAASVPQGSPSATPRPADSRVTRQTPNLGYYRAASGNARAAQWQAYTDPNDPRIYRGPLSGRG